MLVRPYGPVDIVQLLHSHFVKSRVNGVSWLTKEEKELPISKVNGIVHVVSWIWRKQKKLDLVKHLRKLESKLTHLNGLYLELRQTQNTVITAM